MATRIRWCPSSNQNASPQTLTELKVPHELIIRKGAKHGWPTMGEDHAFLADWFDKHMPATNQAAK